MNGGIDGKEEFTAAVIEDVDRLILCPNLVLDIDHIHIGIGRPCDGNAFVGGFGVEHGNFRDALAAGC